MATTVFKAQEALRKAKQEQQAHISAEDALANAVLVAEATLDNAERAERENATNSLIEQTAKPIEQLDFQHSKLIAALEDRDLPAYLAAFNAAVQIYAELKHLNEMALQAANDRIATLEKLNWSITPHAMVLELLAHCPEHDKQVFLGMAVAAIGMIEAMPGKLFDGREYTRGMANNAYATRNDATRFMSKEQIDNHRGSLVSVIK